MKQEPTLNINLAEFSDEELLRFKKELEAFRDKFTQDWAEDLKDLTGQDSNFDPYTFWGERKLKKLAKKHAEKTDGLIYLQEMVAREVQKRDKFKEEQLYAGTGIYKNPKISKEAFLQREQEKTDRFRTKK